jgi:hypothetical protein
MNTGIQTPDVVHVLEQLQTADANLELPVIDPSALEPVYPIQADWVRQGVIAANTASTTINGAFATFTDTDPTDFTLRFDALNQGAIQTGRNRQYNYIDMVVAGGTVTPIVCEMALNLPGVFTIRVIARSIANPSRMLFGPIFVPAGWDAIFSTLTVGGVGDVVAVSLIGIQAPTGVPIPTFSGLTAEIGLGV